MWPAQRPVVGVEAGRRPVGRPAIAQPAGPPVLFRRQFGTCSLGATGRASAPRGLRQGKANVRKDTERSVAAERSRHSRRSLPTLLHCRPGGRGDLASAPAAAQPEAEVEDRIRIAVGVPGVPDCRSERRAVHERNNPVGDLGEEPARRAAGAGDRPAHRRASSASSCFAGGWSHWC